MKCPNCGGKLYINQYQYHCNGCDRYYDVCYFHDRAEKAEGELKAIKARIEAVGLKDICKIINRKGRESYALCKPVDILELIKQIGGEK